MLVRDYKCEHTDESASNNDHVQPNQAYPLTRRKLNPSIEKKIERLRFDAKQQFGWSYNDFVVQLLEVLVILQHRDKAKRSPASKQRITEIGS